MNNNRPTKSPYANMNLRCQSQVAKSYTVGYCKLCQRRVKLKNNMLYTACVETYFVRIIGACFCSTLGPARMSSCQGRIGQLFKHNAAFVFVVDSPIHAPCPWRFTVLPLSYVFICVKVACTAGA